MNKRHFLITSCILSTILLMSYSANPPQRSTGAPGEDTCAASGCHSRGSSRNGSFDIGGLPDEIVPGLTYPLTITLERNTARITRGGFQMTILNAEETTSVGTLSTSSAGVTISKTAGRQYAEHQPALSFAGERLTYTVDWTAPAEITDEALTLYASSVLANGNGNRNGDNVLNIKARINVATQPKLSLSADITPATCGTANGGINLTVTGGTPPYRYSWSTQDTSASLTKLTPGSYSIEVTDQEGLLVNETYVVEGAPDLDPPVFQCIDTLRISACVPFSYQRPVAIDECEGAVHVQLIDGSGPGTEYPLGISYDVYSASDRLDNTATCTLTIINQPQIEINATISDIPCHNDSVGSVVLDLSGSNAPFSVAVMERPDLSLNALPEGMHTLQITDRTGCVYQREVTIHRPAPLIIDTVIVQNSTSSTSGNGELTPQIIGGTPPYTYLWRTEDEDFSTEGRLSGLFAGDYTLLVTDDRGCSAQSDTLTVQLSTSTHEITTESDLRVFPTITTGPLRIENYTGYQITSTKVTNINGVTTVVEGNINHLPSGIYFLTIELNSGDIYHTRLIKM